MKRYFGFILSLIIVSLTVGCTKKGEPLVLATPQGYAKPTAIPNVGWEDKLKAISLLQEAHAAEMEDAAPILETPKLTKANKPSRWQSPFKRKLKRFEKIRSSRRAR